MQIYNYLHNYQNWVTYFRLPNLGNAVVWECGLPAAYLSQKLKHRRILQFSLSFLTVLIESPKLLKNGGKLLICRLCHQFFLILTLSGCTLKTFR